MLFEYTTILAAQYNYTHQPNTKSQGNVIQMFTGDSTTCQIGCDLDPLCTAYMTHSGLCYLGNAITAQSPEEHYDTFIKGSKITTDSPEPATTKRPKQNILASAVKLPLKLFSSKKSDDSDHESDSTMTAIPEHPRVSSLPTSVEGTVPTLDGNELVAVNTQTMATTITKVQNVPSPNVITTHGVTQEVPTPSYLAVAPAPKPTANQKSSNHQYQDKTAPKRGKPTYFYVSIAAGIVVSLILSLILISKFLRKNAKSKINYLDDVESTVSNSTLAVYTYYTEKRESYISNDYVNETFPPEFHYNPNSLELLGEPPLPSSPEQSMTSTSTTDTATTYKMKSEEYE